MRLAASHEGHALSAAGPSVYNPAMPPRGGRVVGSAALAAALLWSAAVEASVRLAPPAVSRAPGAAVPVGLPPAPSADAPELAPTPIRPGPLQRWTLVGVMRVVEVQHPKIKALAAQRAVLDAQVLTARSSIPNPSLLSDNGTAEYTYRLGISQTLELGGKRRRRVDVASSRHGVLDAELRILAASLRAEARRTYMEAYFAQEREKQLIALIGSVDYLLRVADARPGDIPAADLLEARITRLKARQALEQAKFEHLQADIRLNNLLGNDPNVELDLASPARDQPPRWLDGDGDDDWREEFLAAYELLIDEALRQRPELARLKRAREVLGREERLARANRAPNMSLSAGPDYVPGGRPQVGAFVMVGLELPIFNRQQGPLAEARARRDQLDKEEDAQVHEIARQLADAVAFACFQRAQLRLYERELMPTADAVYDDALRAFLDQKAPFLVPVRAQEGRVLVYLEHLRALASYHAALAGVEQALGFPAI